MRIFIIAIGILFANVSYATGIPNKWLVSAEAKGSFNTDDLKKSFPFLASNIKNGYTSYRITYNTFDADGASVIASGALFVPDAKGPFPLLNYNHGTLFPAQEKNAPSYLGNGFEMMVGKLFSSAGYVVVMPDYIGYGSTKNKAHPYGAYPFIAVTVTDMLRAVKEFCEKNNIALSGKNFFSGWSEGAAVALATVKLLEEKYKGEFTPTASVLNAGPYYTSGFASYVLDAKEPLNYMKSYAWILQSYNQVYNINKPLNYYFKEPVATELKEGNDKNIPKDPKELFTSSFISNYKSGKETDLLNAINSNDLWNWKPASKIVFCHGDKDEYVPLFNSEKAYNSMKEKGADVSLQVFKGHTHSSGAFSFMQQAFSNFEKEK
jgi:acetyl esterase/lipase